MYVQTRTEVRTVRPLFIENPTFDLISIKRPGFNLGIVTQAERIKIVALANGKVSVKGLGKGGFRAVHLSGNSRIVKEGERSVSLSDLIWLYQQSGLNLAVVIP
jgi:hypothetical protein